MREYVRFSKNRTVHGIIGILLDILDVALVTLFVIILLAIYVFHFASVQGDSMLPTLQNGNHLLVNALSRNPECGDIVIITAGDPQTSPRQGDYTTSTNMCMVAQVQ